MADFNTPSLTDNYTNFLAYLKNRDADIMMGLDPATTAPANLPDNAIRWNSASNKWEKQVSGTWSPLTSSYAIDVATIKGYAPGNASGNIPLSNGTLNTNLNADMVDGYHAGTAANQVLLLDANAHIPAASIPTTGVGAGTYRSVTVGTDGRITAGSNPTTLAGYGITDAASIGGNSAQNFSMNTGTFYTSLKSQYMTAALTAGDIAAVRSGGTTGVIFLSADGTKYLYWDGTKYNLPGGSVYANGQQLATLASPALTGSPTAPTPAVGNNSTAIATTAYFMGQASSTTPAMDGTAAVGTGTTWARADHVHPTDTSRLAVTAQAADSAKLGGNLPSYYAPLAGPNFSGLPQRSGSNLVALADFSTNLAMPGYQGLPTGLILQFTKVTVTTAAAGNWATAAFNWPEGFPVACLAAFLTQHNTSNMGQCAFLSDPTATGGTVYYFNQSGNSGQPMTINILGIGH